MNPQTVRVLCLLREIELLAQKLRDLVSEGREAEADRFDAALARLRAARPRVEALAGSGAL